MGKKLSLQDVRILEYGNMICAPYCSKLMADLGAEVVKIEKPNSGDDARRRGPFAHNIAGNERSGFFIYLNTNKKSVTLDIEKKTGREIFKKLVKNTDIFIEDTAPGMLEKFGLGYNELKTLNPKLIMVSITFFGQTGPYKNFKGSDLIGFHMGGIGYTTPRWAGTPEQEPLRVMQLADFFTAMAAATAAMSALHVQREHGIGQHVDLSQLEAMIRLNPQNIARWPYTHTNDTRVSESELGPQQFFRCKDGWCFVHAEEPHHWKHFVEIMGNPEWASDEIYESAPKRAQHWDIMKPLVEKWAMHHTKLEIFEAAKGKIPLAPSNTIDEVLCSRQLKERRYFIDIDHPAAGKFTYPGAPHKFSRSEWSVRNTAPLLGQHNEEIYVKHLGYSVSELAKMAELGII
ncbi:MAG: CoA transferase [Syntrophales bacterium]|jgi:crotonobetainyl-CoA:carnitine CoA-transferase CaiB-like acyl-CoA transferase|nr:CoA transferase [Syntrophales bacterium]MDY0043724.1 CoA transferase [Syntrophales bacterium]